MELRQSEEWGKFLQSLGWQTETSDGCSLRIRQVGPFGSIIKIQRPENLPLAKIDEIAKKNRALFVKVEPLNDSQAQDLISNRYQIDTWPLTPSRTVFINLKQSETELLGSFSKDTRQAIRRALSLKLSPIVYNPTSKDFDHALGIFHDLLRQTGKNKGFWVPPLRELGTKAAAFGENCCLILTFRIYERLRPETNLLPLSGAFLILHDKVGYYHHAASLHLGQLVKASYLCLWEALKTAKTMGAEKMDLEGIFDPRFPSMFKKWINFSTFKLKWSGEIKEYPSNYINFFSPIVKLFFGFAK